MAVRKILIFWFFLAFQVRICLGDHLVDDLNQDGFVTALAFGDSITRGVGDGLAPGLFIDFVSSSQVGSGYPGRLRSFLGIPVSNSGVPGEIATIDGVRRLSLELASQQPDLVLVMEGSNDAIFAVSSREYADAIQSMINYAFAYGAEPVLITLLPPCCNRAGRSAFTEEFSRVLRKLALINDITLIDLERVWKNSCDQRLECSFYNLPDGLHPNTRGYDLLAQAISGALLDIDLFSSDVASEIEGALGLAEDSVLIKPDQVLGDL